MAETYIDESGYLRFSDSGKSVHRWMAQKMCLESIILNR